MKRLFALFTALMVLATSVSGQDDKTLLEIAKKGFEARARARGILDKEASVPAFRKPFEGLEDSQKIKAIAFHLFDIDQSDSKLSMSAGSAVDATDALSDDPDFIHDWSSLGPMLEHELDSRKFYLLSKLVPWTKEASPHDFIAERTHMLFADGRVTKREGEYTREYAGDVSKYAYLAITGRLRVLGADFIPPAKNLSHEEQVVILVKWLRDNWPGCENVGDEEPLMANTISPRKQLTTAGVRPKKPFLPDMPTESVTQLEELKPWWLMISVGLLLVVVIWLKQKRKSRI